MQCELSLIKLLDQMVLIIPKNQPKTVQLKSALVDHFQSKSVIEQRKKQLPKDTQLRKSEKIIMDKTELTS